MSHIITRTNKHITNTLIKAKYLRNQVAKKDKTLMANRFDELTDHYTKLYENKTLEKPLIDNIAL